MKTATAPVRCFGAFRELDLVAIRPEGWLRSWLERQRDGLTGHLEHAGFPFNTEGWRTDPLPRGAGFGRAWWPYEQYAYWIDGLARCGWLLDDAALLRKAYRQLNHVLNHPDRDGYLGPRALKQLTPEGRVERWPHAVLFRALTGHLPPRRRREILHRLTRHYLSGTADHADGRNLCNLEIMLWLYGQTGDRRLLDYARKSFRDFNRRHPRAEAGLRRMRSRAPARDHGVNYCEMSKLPAILYLYTGTRRFRSACVNAYRKLLRDYVLVDGVPSSTEHLRDRNALSGHETCVIADYPWSLGYLLLATGDATYADRIEQACFNAAPGAALPNFKALQYFSSPNQVVADRFSNHHRHGFGWGHMSYRPNPATECCPGNATRIVPNYVARMWMALPRGGLAASLYGPSAVTFSAGQAAAPVTIVEETNYPFSETIAFTVRSARPVTFPLLLRIPGWCRRARLRINGRPYGGKLRRGTFVTLKRRYRDGDRLELDLPMELRQIRVPGGGVSITRGPLLFALPVPERRRRDRRDARSSDEFPAWNLRPAGPWNYALATFSKHWKKCGGIFPGIGHNGEPGFPWDGRPPPIVLRMPAVRVPGWRARRLRVIRDKWHGRRRGDFLMTPPLPSPGALARASRKIEWITLVPYGCTRLRIAVFPAAR